jgi:hypothetical protein
MPRFFTSIKPSAGNLPATGAYLQPIPNRLKPWLAKYLISMGSSSN